MIKVAHEGMARISACEALSAAHSMFAKSATNLAARSLVGDTQRFLWLAVPCLSLFGEQPLGLWKGLQPIPSPLPGIQRDPLVQPPLSAGEALMRIKICTIAAGL